jgi:hypothetical protein
LSALDPVKLVKGEFVELSSPRSLKEALEEALKE